MSNPRLIFAVLFTAACGGGDFQVPPQPDARVSLDLSSNMNFPPADMTCFNTACGGCSALMNWDGTPTKVGDPCLWNGTYQCSGSTLTCSSNACPMCSTKQTGSICGADGHTIIELVNSTGSCVAYDLGSAIDRCNHGPSDKCQARCTANASAGTVDCAAHCLSDDGGGTGCDHTATETCNTLENC